MSDTYIGNNWGNILNNQDHDTGIHYGVISQHTPAGWVMGEAEPIYPPLEGTLELECDECEELWSQHVTEGEEVRCPECDTVTDYEFDPNWGADQPSDWDLDIDDTETEYSELLSAIYVIKSPFYTLTRYCSPCAPNAGDLDGYHPQGIKTYCLGPDCFDEDNPLPYPVWRVDNDELVAGKELLESDGE